LLKSRGSGFREIGLRQPESWGHTLWIGVVSCVLAIGVLGLFQFTLLNIIRIDLQPITDTMNDAIQGNLSSLLISIILAWTTISFAEEIVYRAFLMNWVVALLKNTGSAWKWALIINATVFGLAHYAGGVLWMLETCLLGLIFGIAYVHTNRNLWVPIIAHGLFNTIRFIAMFTGVY
jgi:membrane protease YdiL (CAAX protease family)